MNKWTPGKWIVGGRVDYHTCIRSEDGMPIANVYSAEARGAKINNPTRDANTRLIAAAPEMAEALAGMLHIHDSVTQGQEQELRDKWIPTTRALLAKIKGE